MVLTEKYKTSTESRHSSNVSTVLCIKDKLISTGDEGKIKIWSNDLKQISEIDITSNGAVLSVAAGPESIYTCTSDGTIQVRDKKELQVTKVLKTTLVNPLKIFYQPDTDVFWIGDALGKVGRFKNDEEQGTFELTEEIWDLHVTADPTLIFTARDRDVVVSEVVKGELRSHAVIRATVFGRNPINVGKNFVCCLDRDGRTIQVHENSVSSKFKLIREIPASDLIINAMCRGDEDTVYIGGYDNHVSLWNITNGEKIGSVDVGSCVNFLSPSENGVFVALSDGNIVFLEK